MQRGVAQPGSAPGLGPGGRRFESCRPDKIQSKLLVGSRLKRMRQQLSWQSTTLPRSGSRVRVSFAALFFIETQISLRILLQAQVAEWQTRTFQVRVFITCRFESCSGHRTYLKYPKIHSIYVGEVAEWQTRYFEGVVKIVSWEFESPPLHIDKFVSNYLLLQI